MEDEKLISKKCFNCGGSFCYKKTDIIWDESWHGSTKLIKCPECGKYIVLKYIQDLSLDLNNDDRYYEY